MLSERREKQIEERNKTAGGARQDGWNGMSTLKNCLACSYFPVAVFIPQYFVVQCITLLLHQHPRVAAHASLPRAPALSHACRLLVTHG